MSAVLLAELNVFDQLATLGNLIQQQTAENQELKMRLGNAAAYCNSLFEENQQLKSMIMDLSARQLHYMAAEPDGQAPVCNTEETGSTPVAASRDHSNCVQCEGTGLVGHPSWGVKCPLGE